MTTANNIPRIPTIPHAVLQKLNEDLVKGVADYYAKGGAATLRPAFMLYKLQDSVPRLLADCPGEVVELMLSSDSAKAAMRTMIRKMLTGDPAPAGWNMPTPDIITVISEAWSVERKAGEEGWEQAKEIKASESPNRKSVMLVVFYTLDGTVIARNKLNIDSTPRTVECVPMEFDAQVYGRLSINEEE